MNKKNEVKVFAFGESSSPVRVQLVNGEPWFVAKDVASLLNITWNGKTLVQIPERWKGMRNFLTPKGNQNLTVISEAGMYKLAFRCQSSVVADRFTEWVAGEVLPSIRKTGVYELPSRKRRSLPRERGPEWTDFYVELTRCTTMENEQTISELLHVTRKHVHEVATGRKQGYEVCRLLVECACDNRKKGVFRAEVVRDRLEEMDVLRGQLMFDFMDEED